MPHIAHETETATDLTMCAAELAPVLDWTVMTSSGESDHCSIIVTYLRKEREEEEEVQNSIGWNYKRANLDRYRKLAVWSALPEDMTRWTI